VLFRSLEVFDRGLKGQKQFIAETLKEVV